MKVSSGLNVESTIRGTGARVTSSRVQVLSLLQSVHGPLSHIQVENLLSEKYHLKIDRVTLYRVLDWLVEVGLAHKASNARGVFCFSAAETNIQHKQHMHFRCTDCGSVLCLDMPLPSPPKLPSGFRLSNIEFDISGECPDCAHGHSHSEQNRLEISTL
jgi:Fur family transcriptional regulator, ferric uptake regulator